MCTNLQKYPRFISEKNTFQNDNTALSDVFNNNVSAYV